MRGSRGFSLVELVIVVMIIGVLGAIAIPRLSRGSEGASINAFVAEINTFATVIERYQLETGNTISDSSTGEFPKELANYLHENAWQGDTPLGGEWDIESNDNGVGLAVGVHFQRASADEDSFRQADVILDDGNLSSGMFRKLESGRYYLVLQEQRVAGGGDASVDLNVGDTASVNLVVE